jgi:hypothetical protein
MIQSILYNNHDITLQLFITSDQMNGLPNQTLIAIFLKFISNHLNKYIKIAILANEVKLLNMVLY